VAVPTSPRLERSALSLEGCAARDRLRESELFAPKRGLKRGSPVSVQHLPQASRLLCCRQALNTLSQEMPGYSPLLPARPF